VFANHLPSWQPHFERESIRFWTGRQSLEGVSVCYRDAWASAHPGAPGRT